MKTRLFIGIDPGKNGGIAWIADGKPYAEKISESLGDLRDLLQDISRDFSTNECKVFLEKVHSSPQMGVVSAFSFGKGFGQLEMACICLRLPLERVSPNVWQTYLKCRTGGDKNISKSKAQELFPELKITHAIADSLLIAEYGRRISQ